MCEPMAMNGMFAILLSSIYRSVAQCAPVRLRDGRLTNMCMRDLILIMVKVSCITNSFISTAHSHTRWSYIGECMSDM